MTTEFYKQEDGKLVARGSEGWRFICDDFMSRKHQGTWNSRLMSFRTSEPHFSDGVPVTSYEQFN